MGVSTRKRAAAAAVDPLPDAAAKRTRAARSPAAAASPAARGSRSPAATPPKQAPAVVPKKGSRGAAFLAAAGIAVPSASGLPSAEQAPRLSTKKESATKARRQAEEEAAAPAPDALLRAAATAPQRNPLLDQALPGKLAALLDMFAGLQTTYEMMRKRGQRTTFQNMRQAVEEASGRRFLLAHVAQLRHLLPEAVELEWIKLPVAAQSSRTEPHLLITLHAAAAGAAAAAAGVVSAGGALQTGRALLQSRLAAHLLDSYRGHLGQQAAQLRQEGDAAAAEQLEAAAAAAAEPPVHQFLAPYPEGAADVPQGALPQRPEAASRGGSPAVLAGAAAGAAQLAVPSTPATSVLKPPPSTSKARTGRPPMHPSTVDRLRLMHRRLSFSQAAGAVAAAAAAAGGELAGATPAAPAVAADLPTGRGTQAATPLDKLTADLEAQVHPSQRKLAAHLAAAGDDFGFGAGGGLPLSQDDASLLASMPEQLRRMSTEGIISLETLRKLDAAEQQHRRLSSKEAVEARESSAALGLLPRTFSRLQRIFGVQGPSALKLHDVVRRIKQGAETSSEAQIHAQLQALAEHAPEYLTLKPYGSCGTPAVWVDRRCNANALMARLKEAAASRRAFTETASRRAAVEAAA